MDRPRPDIGETLDRLQPVLEWIFTDYGIPPDQAAAIVEECCRILIAKRPRPQEPAVWLLRNVIERCERSGEEKGFEDPPA
ncbi:MAG TPA: hypothetical protein VKK31_24325 [Thermoanaerobaculia bacterium]|nr:hypothetical protein [Thermoanaerobaculia bacterium]